MQMRRLIYFSLKIRQHPRYGGAFPLGWPEPLGPVAEAGGLPSPAQLPQNQLGGAFREASYELRSCQRVGPLTVDSRTPALPLTGCVTLQYLLNLSRPPFPSLRDGNTDVLVLS